MKNLVLGAVVVALAGFAGASLAASSSDLLNLKASSHMLLLVDANSDDDQAQNGSDDQAQPATQDDSQQDNGTDDSNGDSDGDSSSD